MSSGSHSNNFDPTCPFKRGHVRPSHAGIGTLPQSMTTSGSEVEDAVVIRVYSKTLQKSMVVVTRE